VPKGQKETDKLEEHTPSPSLRKPTAINLWFGIFAVAVLCLFVVIMVGFVRKRLDVQIHHQ
jgi:hypothetical protein